MSRSLLCKKCDEGVGFHRAYPSEIERVVWGIAKRPIPERPNTLQLSLDHYDCDYCGSAIKPGDIACAFSVWQSFSKSKGRSEMVLPSPT